MVTPQLKRTLSLPLLTFYGLGSILGAGVYVLLGTVSAVAGSFLPLSFLCATVIAGFTAFSYAEFSARMPRSGGEAVYVDAAFGARWLTLVIGYGAIAVGIVSAATISSGFVGYFELFIELDPRIVVVAVITVLGTLAASGMQVAAWAAAAMTIVEIGGLLLIVVLAGPDLLRWTPTDFAHVVPDTASDWRAVSIGAFLAFFAFLGFEDMVNVAEEARDPERNMPRAILIALFTAGTLYLLITFAALASLPINELARDDTPLATIAGVHGVPSQVIAAIALLAITNGALVQIIKSSRVLYGMAGLGDAPAIFARIATSTSTPVIATTIVSLTVLTLALWLPTRDLASITSLVTLVIFAVINAALFVLKRRSTARFDAFDIPQLVPLIGCALCLGLIASQLLG